MLLPVDQAGEKPGIFSDLYKVGGRIGYTNEVIVFEEKGKGKS